MKWQHMLPSQYMKITKVTLERSESRTKRLIAEESLPDEKWKPYTVNNKTVVQISNYGRYIKPFSTKIVTADSLNFAKNNRVGYFLRPMWILVAEIFMNYDPNNHFIIKSSTKTEYPNAESNLMLIDKYSYDDDGNKEIWVDIPNHYGYQISNFGRVCNNIPNPVLLKLEITNEGYNRIMLGYNDRSNVFQRYLVHRLVYQSFHPDEDIDDLIINHKNSVKDCNRLDNLEAITQKQNVAHSIQAGTFMQTRRNYSLNDGLIVPVTGVRSGRKQLDTAGFRM